MKAWLDKIDFGNWPVVLNENTKWGVTFFIRVTSVVLTVIFMLLVIKWTGITKDLKETFSDKPIQVVPKETVIKDTPNINDSAAVSDIDTIINILKNKKAQK